MILMSSSPVRRGQLTIGDSAAGGGGGGGGCSSSDVGGGGSSIGGESNTSQQQQHRPMPLSELDCTQTDVQRVHVSSTYKPRI